MSVESMNKMMKGKTHSNHNLSKSVSITTQSFDKRFDDHRKNPSHEVNVVNRSSQAHTKKYTETKAQYLFDITYDARQHVKAVHYSKDLWYVWDFREVNRTRNVDDNLKLSLIHI